MNRGGGAASSGGIDSASRGGSRGRGRRRARPVGGGAGVGSGAGGAAFGGGGSGSAGGSRGTPDASESPANVPGGGRSSSHSVGGHATPGSGSGGGRDRGRAERHRRRGAGGIGGGGSSAAVAATKARAEERERKEREQRERSERERAEKERIQAQERERERALQRENERIAKEQAEEAKRLAEEEAARLADEAARMKAEKRWEERQRNAQFRDDDRPSEAQLRKLESSLKKCTAFVRRVNGDGGGSGVGDEGLRRESRNLNLTRYISEVVAGIADTRVRASETLAAVMLCGEMHRRYADFADLLKDALIATVSSSAKEAVARRSALRVLVELVVVGVLTDPVPVFAVVKEAMKAGRGVSDAELTNLSVVAVFTKVAARSFLLPEKVDGAVGLELGATGPSSNPATIASEEVKTDESGRVTEKPQQTAFATIGEAKGYVQEGGGPPAWEEDVLPKDIKVSMTGTLQAYSREVLGLLGGVESALQEADSSALVSRITRGVEDEAAVETASSLRKHHERIHTAMVSIAEALGRSPPLPYVFKADSGIGTSSREGARIVVGSFGGGGRAARMAMSEPDCGPGIDAEHQQPFEGDQELAFYRELPELMFPNPEKDSPVASADSDPSAPDSGSSKPATARLSTGPGASKRAKAGSTSGDSVTLDALLGRLWVVDSLETANAFVGQFCTVSVSNRTSVKRLTKLLGQVPAQYVGSVPAYARIAASLRPRFPDVYVTVGASIEEDLRALIARTDHDEKSSASFIKAARYLGEYVKFELLPANTFFDLLGVCMKDFTGPKVEIACHLLETTGRFLYRSPTTAVRMGNVLDTVWRLKSVRNLEARYNALVETAYFASRPRGSTRPVVKKRREPIHEYIRWRIYVQLSDSNIEWTATHFRKLPWDPDLEMYVIRKFLDVTCMRFSMYSPIAKLLAGLSKDRSSLGVAVVDGLVEAIIVGLERNDGRESQRRVAQIVLLGELFNSGLVQSPVIFQILYLVITFGHESSHPRTRSTSIAESSSETAGVAATVTISSFEAANAAIPVARVGAQVPDDIAGDFFRVRLACALLDTCGVCLVTPPPHSRKRVSPSKRQLEVFWIYFERYFLTKAAQNGNEGRLPLHMEHIIADTYEKVIRPLRTPLSVLSSSDLRHRLKGRGVKAVSSAASQGSGADERPLDRSKTLHDAVDAVLRVEAKQGDLCLVALPQRKWEPAKQSKPGLTADLSPTRASPLPARKQLLDSRKGGNTVISDEGIGDVGEEEEDEDYVSQDSSDGPELGSSDGDESSLSRGDGDDGADSLEIVGGNVLEDASDGGVDFDERDGSSSESSDVSDDEDDDCVVTNIPQVKTEEEDEFEKELAAFTSAEVSSARKSFTGHSTLDRMAIPIGLMAKHQEVERAAAVDAASSHEMSGQSGPYQPVRSKDHTVAFKMLVRRGGKSQIKELAVPAASSLAVATKESQSVGAAAHEELKRLVLESNAVVNGGEESAEGNGEDDLVFDAVASSKQKERSISEQRAADEQALLSTLFKAKPR